MLNHIAIMGRLTRDPELRRTGSNVAVTNFTIAVDRDYSGPNKEKKTDFIDCVAWRQTGEFVSKYFHKGSMIAVSGRLEIRDWTDKDGNKRKAAEINVENAYFGSSKSESGTGSYSAPANTGGYQSEAERMVMDAMYGNGGYGVPASTDGYAMLTDDDAQLPF
jgi:single-strand DNA-binding protein